MQSGGGALGLAGTTKGGCGEWLQQVEGDAEPVPGAWALLGCGSVDDCAGGAAGWVAKCWMWGCVAQVLACFARSAALYVGIPPGGVCEYTTCSDLGVPKGTCNE